MAKRYTLERTAYYNCSTEIKDGDNVILGVGLPTTAGAMAKALHAPNATLMMESGIIDIEPLVPPTHRGCELMPRIFVCHRSLFDVHYDIRGFVDVCFLGVARSIVGNNLTLRSSVIISNRR